MAIQQLTVFLENKPGALLAVTEILTENNVNLRALSLAETEAFGILRLIVNDEEKAEKVLEEKGYIVKVIDVVGVKIGDQPGKLSATLKVLSNAGINVEYLYAFMARTQRHAYVVMRVEDNKAAEETLEAAGFHIITEPDILKL